MLRILLMSFFIASYCLSFGQKPLAPVRLRCDYLLNTEKVGSSGTPTTKSLEEAVKQKEHYEFVQIVSQNPAFDWELAGFLKK